MCIINLPCTYFILNFECNGSGAGSRIAHFNRQGRRCDVARVVTLCDWYASLYTSLPCHRVQFDKSGRGCHYLQVIRHSQRIECAVEVASSDLLCRTLGPSSIDDGSTVADVEQEEKEGALCRRSNYFSCSVEIIRTPLPGSATVYFPFHAPNNI